jgi:hypothetical protein
MPWEIKMALGKWVAALKKNGSKNKEFPNFDRLV